MAWSRPGSTAPPAGVVPLGPANGNWRPTEVHGHTGAGISARARTLHTSWRRSVRIPPACGASGMSVPRGFVQGRVASPTCSRCQAAEGHGDGEKELVQSAAHIISDGQLKQAQQHADHGQYGTRPHQDPIHRARHPTISEVVADPEHHVRRLPGSQRVIRVADRSSAASQRHRGSPPHPQPRQAAPTPTAGQPSAGVLTGRRQDVTPQVDGQARTVRVE